MFRYFYLPYIIFISESGLTNGVQNTKIAHTHTYTYKFITLHDEIEVDKFSETINVSP